MRKESPRCFQSSSEVCRIAFCVLSVIIIGFHYQVQSTSRTGRVGYMATYIFPPYYSLLCIRLLCTYLICSDCCYHHCCCISVKLDFSVRVCLNYSNIHVCCCIVVARGCRVPGSNWGFPLIISTLMWHNYFHYFASAIFVFNCRCWNAVPWVT